ncbi:hypothetical protein GFK26_18040 [Variovorax paradoxus]|uniref:Uncharacterized protein n=1 Tax=Variovorax paradoxus TaxID=34073 RepID=A0A5Q0M453_VARPD|nr:hypothetical protein [Variovorax paradoxus]QFZ84530.1 hypothetical protein GFK26_18040 [Variovorax paradoxus]
MADSHRISEPKPAKDGNGTVRQVRQNRRKIGELRTYKLATGKRLNIFHAPRRTDQRLHDRQAWTVDVDTVSALRNYGLTHVLLMVEDGTKLLAPATLFGPEGLARGVEKRVQTTPGRPLPTQYVVPDALWHISLPPPEQRSEEMLKQVRIKRGRLPKAKT